MIASKKLFKSWGFTSAFCANQTFQLSVGTSRSKRARTGWKFRFSSPTGFLNTDEFQQLLIQDNLPFGQHHLEHIWPQPKVAEAY